MMLKMQENGNLTNMQRARKSRPVQLLHLTQGNGELGKMFKHPNFMHNDTDGSTPRASCIPLPKHPHPQGHPKLSMPQSHAQGSKQLLRSPAAGDTHGRIPGSDKTFPICEFVILFCDSQKCGSWVRPVPSAFE